MCSCDADDDTCEHVHLLDIVRNDDDSNEDVML
jgi:hypothetical protein